LHNLLFDYLGNGIWWQTEAKILVHVGIFEINDFPEEAQKRFTPRTWIDLACFDIIPSLFDTVLCCSFFYRNNYIICLPSLPKSKKYILWKDFVDKRKDQIKVLS